MLIYYIIIILILNIACYILGCGIHESKAGQYIKLNIFITGYVGIVFFFALVSIPFMYFHSKFTYLYWTFLLGLGVLLIFRAKCFLKHILYSNDLSAFIKKRNTSFWIALLLICTQILLYIILKHRNTDDSWYIALSNTVLEHNKIFDRDPSCGNIFHLFATQYELVGHELLIAVICKFFSVSPAVACHTVIPVFFLEAHYIIIYALSRKMNQEHEDIIFLLITLINMFSRYSTSSRGCFLLERLWQGKAVLVNLALPLLLLVFWNIYESKEVSKSDIALLTVCTYYAFHLSAVGLYMFPLSYAIYTLLFFSYSRKWAETMKLCIPMILAIPYVFLKWMMISTTDLTKVIAAADELDWFSLAQQMTGGRNFIWGIWIITIVFIIVSGKKEEKYLLGFYPLLCLVTFLNPLFCKMVAEYLTGTTVYWRLFWDLQTTFTISGAFACCYRLWKRNKNWIVIPSIVLVLTCGKSIYKKDMRIAENYENISNTSINLADTMIKTENLEGGLLLPREYAYEIRQYSGKIELIWTKYAKHHYTPERLNELSVLFNQLYEDREYSSDIVNDLKKFNVVYLALYTSVDNTDFSNKYSCIYSDNKITVYDITSPLN